MKEKPNKVPIAVAMAPFIEDAASYMVEGLDPQTLILLGRYEEGQRLAFTIGRLNDFKLGGVLSSRIESLRKEKEVPAINSLSVEDPERRINSLHIQQKRFNQGNLIKEDVKYEVGEMRKKWRFKTNGKTERVREKFEEAIDRLKRAGVWKYIEGGNLNSVIIPKLQAKLRAYQGRDWNSTEGVTIYPDEDSFNADRYDVE